MPIAVFLLFVFLLLLFIHVLIKQLFSGTYYIQDIHFSVVGVQ